MSLLDRTREDLDEEIALINRGRGMRTSSGNRFFPRPDEERECKRCARMFRAYTDTSYADCPVCRWRDEGWDPEVGAK